MLIAHESTIMCTTNGIIRCTVQLSDQASSNYHRNSLSNNCETNVTECCNFNESQLNMNLEMFDVNVNQILLYAKVEITTHMDAKAHSFSSS